MTTPPTTSIAWLARLGLLFSNNAWLSLFTLLVFLGLAGGLMRYSSALEKQAVPAASASDRQGRSAGSVKTSARCGQVLAFFSAATTMREVAALLQSLDAVVVYGPNENGAFELRVGADMATSTVQALEKSSLVSLANVQPACP